MWVLIASVPDLCILFTTSFLFFFCADHFMYILQVNDLIDTLKI